MYRYLLSSFSVTQKLGNVCIFLLLKIENKLNIIITDFNFKFISKHHDQYNFVLDLKLIRMAIIFNLFPFKRIKMANFSTFCITKKLVCA